MEGKFDWKDGLLTMLGYCGPVGRIASTGLKWGIKILGWCGVEAENGINITAGADFEGLEWKSQAPFPSFLWPEKLNKASFSIQGGP